MSVISNEKILMNTNSLIWIIILQDSLNVKDNPGKKPIHNCNSMYNVFQERQQQDKFDTVRTHELFPRCEFVMLYYMQKNIRLDSKSVVSNSVNCIFFNKLVLLLHSAILFLNGFIVFLVAYVINWDAFRIYKYETKQEFGFVLWVSYINFSKINWQMCLHENNFYPTQCTIFLCLEFYFFGVKNKNIKKS